MASKPEQYRKGIDTIKRSEANLTVDECIAVAKFQIDKYTWREKNQDIDDTYKIIFYAKWRLKLLKRKQMEEIAEGIQ